MAKEPVVKKYKLTIEPALEPKKRHCIEKLLTQLGFDVWGGGTMRDKSSCDITFDKK